MLEEDVDELPEKVVGRLGELLREERIRPGGRELPLGAERFEGTVRQPRDRASATAAASSGWSPGPPNVIRMSSLSACRATVSSTEPEWPVSATAGSARLPTMTG